MLSNSPLSGFDMSACFDCAVGPLLRSGHLQRWPTCSRLSGDKPLLECSERRLAIKCLRVAVASLTTLDRAHPKLW